MVSDINAFLRSPSLLAKRSIFVPMGNILMNLLIHKRCMYVLVCRPILWDRRVCRVYRAPVSLGIEFYEVFVLKSVFSFYQQ